MVRRPPLQAVLWDIDGTLLDSEPWHQRATIAVCRRHGHEMTEEDYAGSLGIAFPEFYRQITAVRPMALSFREWADAITDLYLERIDEVEVREGAIALVEGFAARGLKQACVSNSGRRVVEANLDRMGVPHFDFAISRDDVANGKPHPEPYLRAAERLGVAPEACAVIEDSPTGVRSAMAAGMLTIAWPQHPHVVFEAVDHWVEDPASLDWDALCGLDRAAQAFSMKK
ncbi:HAD family hydrolase [Azospirillum thermophilum]|uniref:HAD family phosphatase n=1 Tax=Azospirillum thermophilum TaxID=2202148 RepID=A0A2S2CSP2_9PROT|nr:HAD family phosphatase [Azospirillum thermophilum]AWK87400.1 HAD family phosphatase [Azospirillum thermophilum]